MSMEINENTGQDSTTGGDAYVIVEGGLVQNDPCVPVLDLDVLDSCVVNDEVVNEVLDLRERAVDLGLIAIVESIDEWLGDRAPAGDTRVYAIAQGEPQPYVLVEGGLVQNDPGIPVLDLDVFDSGSDALVEVTDLREVAAGLDLEHIVAQCDEWIAGNL